MNLKIKDFCHFVMTICKSPGMYTLNGTFGEVIAVIETSAKRSNIFKVSSHHGLHPFQKWLASDTRFSNSISFTDFRQFRENFSDDVAALEEFSDLFAKFCKSVPDNEDEVEITITESKAQELSEFISSEERFFEVREKIKEHLYQNSNNRSFLASDYNIFKDKE